MIIVLTHLFNDEVLAFLVEISPFVGHVSKTTALAPDFGGSASGQGTVLLTLCLGPAAIASSDLLSNLVFLEAQQQS